jgi:hypothetical protein
MAAKKRKKPQQKRRQYRGSLLTPRTASAPDANLLLTEYAITDEPLEARTLTQLPPPVRARIADLFEQVHRAPKEVIPELERLVDTYPQVPPFANYLCGAYQNVGETAKAEALIRETYTRHPHYLFAKVNYAQLCLQQGDVDKVPGIFDHTFDLQQLYPRRRRFHLSEFTGFAGVMCRYFCATGEQETAVLYYRMLKHVAPRHPITRQAKRALYPPFWVRWLRTWAAKRLPEHADPGGSRHRP